MIVNFPKYPFIWNYDDMYNPILYENKILDKNLIYELLDPNLNDLVELFPNYLIVEQRQKISKSDAKNISLHTWYLSKDKLFNSDDNSISIESDSLIKYKKKNVFGFIYDPDNALDKSYTIETKKKNIPITIIKNKSSIIVPMIPQLYIHTHNISGIFRFSPRDGYGIRFNDSCVNPRFYTVLDGLICINYIEFI